MQVITLNEEKFRHHRVCPIKKPLVLAFGYFDGVHRGHQGLIQQAQHYAKQHDALTAVVTFWPNPNVMLGKTVEAGAITPVQMKERVMAHYGVDVLITVEFSTWVQKLAPHEFLERLFAQFPVAAVVVGFDFRFGKDGKGNADLLADFPYPVHVIPEIQYQNEKISSTVLRTEIHQGQISHVNHMLGRAYEVCGVVMNGLQNGRKLGYPTANLALQEAYVLPATGVYAVRIYVFGQWYQGMANVGHAPTIRRDELTGSLGNTHEPLIEVNIFDFDATIYGESVRVQFIERIRPEQKFIGVEALKQQLASDKETIRQYFSELINS
ncbi:MAG: riboflavin biosynthesis protein RibF [Culicoidibacterales bacterium]